MNKTEYFTAYGVRERAGHYAKTRRPVHEIRGEDAVPLRRPSRVQPTVPDAGLAQKIREAEILYGMRPQDEPRARNPYKVRDAMVRTAAAAPPGRARPARAQAASHGPAAGAKRVSRMGTEGIRRGPHTGQAAPKAPPRAAPRQGRRSDPDPAMNTDEIFISQKERDARKLEAYRLARKRKIRYQINRALSALLMMTLFVGCALAVVYKLLYVIRDVDVSGSQRYTSEEILQASGVEAGDNLYSFSSRIAENAVTLQYPYVRELDVSRKAPSTVHFTVTEDTAVFYAEIYGEVRALSPSLRVLDRVSQSDIDALGLIRLRMPEIQSAMAGRVVQFREEKLARQIRETTAEILSSVLSERITSVDLRNPYQVSMVADKRFLLEFGSNTDLGIKMKVASAGLADELIKTDVKAQIDLSVSDSTSVILDNQLDLDA